MKKAKTHKIFFAIFAIFMASTMVFTGCSESPMAPTTETDTVQPKLLSRTATPESAANLSPVNLYAEQVISAEQGGQLTLLDVILDVPAGAVDNDTLFSIFIPDDELFFNEFGTDGLAFNTPVKVTMSYRTADLSGVDESSIRIGWLDEGTGQWESMDCQVDFENKVVTGELHHFSAYGLISD